MNSTPQKITTSDLQQMQLPTSIDDVIIQLEKIIRYCEENNNCAGYFAVLYHKVTCKVKEVINKKGFEDGERMERMDVAFARRYIDAFKAWIAVKQTTKSWEITFDSVPDKSLLVVQHLLLGMNAHINLDLSIATEFIMHGYSLDDIHNDFNTINSILADMIENIEDCLTKVNPLMRLLNLKIYKYDEMLVQFSISTARDGAWSFANELAGKAGHDYEDCILARDERIEQLGKSIARPRGLLLRFIIKLIRLFEKKNVGAIVKLLGT